MAGQPPYKPFENDRLKWVNPNSETGKPILVVQGPEDFSLRRPAVLVFLASTDGGSCCAANYERIVFRDRKVVKLAKRFVTMRLNRASTDKKVLKRFKIKKKRPALIVTDNEGVIRARFDLCTNSRDVLKAMVKTLKASKRKAKVARKVLRQFDDVKKALAQPSYRKAGQLLRKIRRVKGGPRAGEVRADRMLRELAAEGARQFANVLKLSDVTQQFDTLLILRHEFWDFPVVKKIRPRIRSLEEDEKTRDVIHDHKGNTVVEEALVLIKKGNRGAGRTLLYKVVREYKGTKAAKRAKTLLAKK